MNAVGSDPRLDEVSALFFRNQLREARARALGDAEDFHDLLFAFERLGAFLRGRAGSGFGDYAEDMLRLTGYGIPAGEEPQADPDLEVLLELVRIARNDALHEGAFARHLTTNAVRVALILEDALMAQVAIQRAKHVMVSSPTCAELWQPLRVVRHAMLANSFSYLPIKDREGHWKLVSDHAVAQFIRAATSVKDRRNRLDLPIAQALERGLKLDETSAVGMEDDVAQVLSRPFGGRPFVVLEADGSRLAGILTPFDLL